MPWKLSSSGLLFTAALLAGCAGKSAPAEVPAAQAVNTPSGCTSSAARFVVGQKASPQLLEQARVKSGAFNVRLLKPDTIVTLEYRSDRLNINADDTSTITSVNCG